MPGRPRRSSEKKVRYAIVGLGDIAQVAILPGFAHARSNSELVALVSGDDQKLHALRRRYKTQFNVHYDQYDELLASGQIDAVYLAVPNSMHRDFAVRAARHGVHVLCEKPMAVTSAECVEMIETAEHHLIKLMIAYRLHFEESTLKAIQLVQSGRIGEPRVFNSVFTEPVRPGDIRTRARLGGGPLFDIGIYCLNASRSLFQEEPLTVLAQAFNGGKETFREINEAVSVILRYPDEKVASFTVSFGAAESESYEVIGTKGSLVARPSYGYTEPVVQKITIREKTTARKFGRKDQFGAELYYFSDCVLKNRHPEPDGYEGLADLRIIEAIEESISRQAVVTLKPLKKSLRPSVRQEIDMLPVKAPRLVRAAPPVTKQAA